MLQQDTMDILRARCQTCFLLGNTLDFKAHLLSPKLAVLGLT
jgi:hypothetical protein